MGRRKEEIVIKESPYVLHSKEHALKYSIAEGSAQSVAGNLGSSFITPFALLIGANSFHIGILSSFSGLVSPIGELFGSRLLEKFSRKKIITLEKTLENLFWLLIMGVAYLSWRGQLAFYLPYILIILYGAVIFLTGMGRPAIFSWMGDLISDDSKGRYFANRNRIVGFVGLVSFFFGGLALDYFKTNGMAIFGFSVLFGLTIIFRSISRNFIKRMFNPNFRVRRGYYFTFSSFVKRYDNFGKFAFYQAVFFFAVMISSPFFAVYMLEDLGFGYLTFTLIAMSSTIFYLIFTPLAGKFSDKYGNVKLLYVSGILFPTIPILWIFLKDPWALFFIPGLISGVANAAFAIAVTNFTYEAVKPQKRGLCVAYTSALVGVGVFLGGLIGGFMIQYLPIHFTEPIFFVFGLSALLMIMASLFFLPQIKDERDQEVMNGFSSDLHHPFRMISSDIVWFKNFIHGK
ncbi:hypothetical protein CO038_01055 [Candidatus Pacearchaeota archaeon CG_4_9_14_0_2_um_filter_39_13]|nr:MFS transporter [Candidatus Pacearchaeota archaeon]OIO43115.1 MAG: hypothetical protein AUJ64_02950 [Candidatus Pacearchaeota archaeon CG1_02_39_14]PJC44963.1 MAG: hypothetical protein CO038_01055 [Candidatus Pacearchaeota archaeon CG_4_9_14_0_2_um_filter_39_13]